MLLIYTLLVKDYSQSETRFKEKGPKGEIDPCSVFVRKIKQQQLDRVADSVGGNHQQCREQFKSPGMLPRSCVRSENKSMGRISRTSGTADRWQLMWGWGGSAYFDEEEVRRDTAQNEMGKAGLEKSPYHNQLTAHSAIRGRRELQKGWRANVTGDSLVFFHAGRGSDELMLLAKPEERDMRVDTERRDEKAMKWSEIVHNHQGKWKG